MKNHHVALGLALCCQAVSAGAIRGNLGMTPPAGRAESGVPGRAILREGLRGFCDPGSHPIGRPRPLAKPTAGTALAAPLSIAQLNGQSHQAAANAIASFTGPEYDLNGFFQFNADTRAFYGDSNRVIALLDALRQRAAGFTAQDADGIVPLVEVIRAGFYLGFYNSSLAYLKNSGGFARRLVPVEAAFFANPALGWGSEPQVKVLSAVGSLLGIGAFGAEAFPGLANLVNQYLAKLPGYGADDVRSAALYSLLSGLDYGLVGVHLYALDGDPDRSPWKGKLSALYYAIRSLSLAKEALKAQGYLLDNAAWWLGRWGEFVPKEDAVDALTAVIDNYGKVAVPTLEASRALSETYGGVDAHGWRVDYAAVLKDLEATLLPVRIRFDSGTVIIKAGDKVARDKLITLYWTMKEVSARFHRLLRKDAPLRPGSADDSITMVIFNSPAEYAYNRFLNGLETDNGGIYIEGEGTFYTWERKPNESIYSLEELFRHEYVHYLAGRFLIPGVWGDAIYDNERLTWFDEGFAEFLAGSTRDQGVPVRKSKVEGMDRGDLMPLSEVLQATYASGWTFYDFSGLLFNYLDAHRKDLLFSLLARLRANDTRGFDKMVADMRSNASLGDAYRAFLTDQIARLPALTIPSTSPAYLQAVVPRPAQDVVGEISDAIQLTLTGAKVFRSPAGAYFTATAGYEAAGDSLAAWDAMDKALDGFLKTLNGKPWNGYKTMTGYFADPVATGQGRVRYRVVLRVKIENGDVVAIRPRAAWARALPRLSIPSPYLPEMPLVLPKGSAPGPQPELAVFDLRGNPMQVPARIGEARWAWDGNDLNGNRAAAGRYLVRLTLGTAIAWRPLVLSRN